MTDIVARLRLFEQDPRFGDGMLVRNAADEIERLRAELADTKANWDAERKDYMEAFSQERKAGNKLRDELAAIKGQEPIARTIIDKHEWVSQGDGTWLGRIESHIPFDELTPLYALPVAPVADKDAIPEVMFDGYAVLQALDKKAAARKSPENVSDVLDAAVRLMRAAMAKGE